MPVFARRPTRPQAALPPFIFAGPTAWERFAIESKPAPTNHTFLLWTWTSDEYEAYRSVSSLFVTTAPVSVQATTPTVREHDERERARTRLRSLKALGNDHDGEGSAGADEESVNAALTFVDRIVCAPPYYAALSSEGKAVIEFHDDSRGELATLTFVAPDRVELLHLSSREPVVVEGSLQEDTIQGRLALADVVIAG